MKFTLSLTLESPFVYNLHYNGYSSDIPPYRQPDADKWYLKQINSANST